MITCFDCKTMVRYKYGFIDKNNCRIQRKGKRIYVSKALFTILDK